MNTKYLFVVGGVMSGVGKGVSSASIGLLLKSRGFSVSAIKIDPYVNVDAGTMNPTEHGEVFVTDDGDETDQDLGNYERFLDIDILSDNYMTTGRVYLSVIEKERNLEYNGRNVEVVPDVPQEVVRRIEYAAKKNNTDIMIIEIGGTVGEYQNILFLEAARMMKVKNPSDVGFVLVSYLPIPQTVGEMKSKPTQYAIRTLNSSGISPDFVLGRASKPLDKYLKEKIANVTSIDASRVISAPDAASIYEVPLVLNEQGLDAEIVKHFGLPMQKARLSQWKDFVKRATTPTETLKIGVVGKYFTTGSGYTLSDAYISVIEAIKHAAAAENTKPEISWINSEDFEKDPSKLEELKNYDGIIVPGGYGSRGIEGKIKAIQFVRENKIPFLGICYGMQMATVEYARNVLGLQDAHTTEINQDTPHPVIHTMEEQKELIAKGKYGGTMRLGAFDCHLENNTHAKTFYEQEQISERHRHRYEFNNAYLEQLVDAGLVISGKNQEKDLVEIIELPREKHPYFVGVQFHPEFKSRPLKPHPLFLGLIQKAKEL